MKKTQRLDKILGHMGVGTRSELKGMVRNGRIRVNGAAVKDSGMQVNPDADRIEVDGKPVLYREYVYVMLNKPPGVVSATEDLRERTVVDLLPAHIRSFDPFPVGRLDKDTEGLLLMTNDGKLAHQLLSPKKHVPKTYYAIIEGIVDERDVAAFASGVELDDGYITMPAKLVLSDLKLGNLDGLQNQSSSRIEITIMEGKFHQVKRMFLAVGKKVLFLKRLAMGDLLLDERLAPGEYRELTEEELAMLKEGQSFI